MPRSDRGGARGRPAARLRLRPVVQQLYRTMGLRRPARGSHGRHRPLFGPVRSGCARLGDAGSTPEPAKGPCTGCRWAVRPTTSTSGRASWSRRASRSTTSRRSGTPSGRSGATRCSRRCAEATGPRRHLGRRAVHVGRAIDTENGFFQFLARLRGGVRDPRWPPRHRRPRDQAQADQGHRQLHRLLPQGLHAARRSELGHRRPQQQGVPRADRRDDAEPVALDPERAQARAARRLLREHRHDRMAAWSVWRALSDHGQVSLRRGLQGWRPRRDRQGVRALPRGRGLARALSRLLRRAHAAADAEAARPAVLARPERPAPHGRGDAGQLAPAAVRLRRRPRATGGTAGSGRSAPGRRRSTASPPTASAPSRRSTRRSRGSSRS